MKTKDNMVIKTTYLKEILNKYSAKYHTFQHEEKECLSIDMGAISEECKKELLHAMKTIPPYDDNFKELTMKGKDDVDVTVGVDANGAYIAIDDCIAMNASVYLDKKEVQDIIDFLKTTIQ